MKLCAKLLFVQILTVFGSICQAQTQTVGVNPYPVNLPPTPYPGTDFFNGSGFSAPQNKMYLQAMKIFGRRFFTATGNGTDIVAGKEVVPPGMNVPGLTIANVELVGSRWPAVTTTWQPDQHFDRGEIVQPSSASNQHRYYSRYAGTTYASTNGGHASVEPSWKQIEDYEYRGFNRNWQSSTKGSYSDYYGYSVDDGVMWRQISDVANSTDISNTVLWQAARMYHIGDRVRGSNGRIYEMVNWVNWGDDGRSGEKEPCWRENIFAKSIISDGSVKWKVSRSYQDSVSVPNGWAASTSYNVNDEIRDLRSGGKFTFRVVQAGTSSTFEPGWPTEIIDAYFESPDNHPTYDVNLVWQDANADVDMRATRKIVLSDGFRAYEGSYLHAYIEPVWKEETEFAEEFNGTIEDVKKTWHIDDWSWGAPMRFEEDLTLIDNLTSAGSGCLQLKHIYNPSPDRTRPWQCPQPSGPCGEWYGQQRYLSGQAISKEHDLVPTLSCFEYRIKLPSMKLIHPNVELIERIGGCPHRTFPPEDTRLPSSVWNDFAYEYAFDERGLWTTSECFNNTFAFGLGKSRPPRDVPAANNGIAEIRITDRGEGYTSEPTVTISGGGGNGATAFIPGWASPFNCAGQVHAIGISNAGSGYTSAPTVTIEEPPLTSNPRRTATAEASIYKNHNDNITSIIHAPFSLSDDFHVIRYERERNRMRLLIDGAVVERFPRNGESDSMVWLGYGDPEVAEANANKDFHYIYLVPGVDIDSRPAYADAEFSAMNESVWVDWIRVRTKATPEVAHADPDKAAPQPSGISISPITPNPAQNSIAFDVMLSGENPGSVKIELFNILGTLVGVLYEGTAQRVKSTYAFPVNDVPNVTYYVRVSSGAERETASFVVQR